MGNSIDQLPEFTGAIEQVARPVHRFFFSPQHRAMLERNPQTKGVIGVGVVELTMAEEIRAADRAQNSMLRAQFENIFESVREALKGSAKSPEVVQLDMNTRTAESFVSACPSAVRTLIANAVNKVNGAKKEDGESFLATQVEVIR